MKGKKGIAKRLLSLVLAATLVLGSLYLGNSSNVSASEVPLSMPEFQDFHIMPAQIAENSSYYKHYDNAMDGAWTVPEGIIVMTKKNGGYQLPYKIFKGMASIIRTEHMVSVHTNKTYRLNIQLGNTSSYYNPYTRYEQKDQLSIRLTYKNTFVYAGEPREVVYQSALTAGSQKTDWMSMRTKTDKNGKVNVSIVGDGVHETSDIMILIADLDMPDVNSFTAKTIDGLPVLWMDCGEQIRPANDKITKTDLGKLKLNVKLVPKLEQSEENAITIMFQATELDNSGQIGFTAMDAAKLQENEWRIIEIADASTEGSYDLITSVGESGLTVSSPITDMAGNPVILEKTLDYRGSEKIYLDAVSPKAVSALISGDMIKNDATTEISQADRFAGVGETLSLSFILSETVSLKEGTSVEDISMKWNIKDKNGNYVTTKLQSITKVNTSVQTSAVSMLKFEPVTVEEGMTIEVTDTTNATTIVPLELIGYENFSDASGNLMSVENLSEVYPDRQIGIDTTAPEITMTSGEVVKQKDSKTEKYYIYPIEISDAAAGLIVADGTPISQYFSVSTTETVENLKWQFAITETADAVTEFAAKDVVTTAQQYKEFKIPKGNGKYFLHVYLNAADGVEIANTIGLKLDFKLTDAKGNSSDTNVVTMNNLGLDSKAPSLSVAPQQTQLTRDTNDSTKVVFSAIVTAGDINGVSLSYQWTDVDVSGPADNNWRTINGSATNGANGEESVEVAGAVTTLSYTAISNGNMQKILWVKAQDVNGNSMTKSETFSVNVTKTNANYEIISDDTQTDGISDVKIYAPKNTDGSVGGYTRVIMTLDNGTYVAVFSHANGDTTTGYSLFDTSAGKWYKVTTDETTYTSVEAGAPDWKTYYGNLTLKIAASSTEFGESSFTPVTGQPVTPPETDLSFKDAGSVTMIYTSKNDNIHKVTINRLTDAAGETLVKAEADAPYANIYYSFDQTFAGVRYQFTIDNTILSGLNTSDVDFTKSYAYFVKTEADGTVTKDANGSITAEKVSDDIPLAIGKEQSIAVPYKASGYESGAYTLVVHLVQKSSGEKEGAMQEFVITDHLLLLDNEPLPSVFGVTEYTALIPLGKDTTNNTLTHNIGKKAETGKVLSSVDIGVGTVTEEEIVYIDGKPAFIKETNNAALYGNTNIELSATINGTTILGQRLGEVTGVRYWNQASSGDPSKIEWNQGFSGNDIVQLGNGAIRATISQNITDKENKDYIVVESAEALAKADVSEFKLLLGHNVICYQLMLENGKLSPVYTFDLNLYPEAPSVDVSYEFGANIVKTEYLQAYDYGGYYLYNSSKSTAYDRLSAQSIAIQVEHAYSPNGDLKLYRYLYKEGDETSGDTWIAELLDMTQSNEIVSDYINGYLGKNGTGTTIDSGDRNHNGVGEYYVFIDEVGNSISYYPIIADSSMYSTGTSQMEGGWPVEVEDEAILKQLPSVDGYWTYETEDSVRTMYYFEKNPNVSAFAAEIYTPDESDDHDGISQILDFAYSYSNGNYGYTAVPSETLEQVSIQIDDRNEVMLDSLDGYIADSNDAGIISFDGRYLNYVFPYDDSVAEGAEIEHTVTVRGYIDGQLAIASDGSKAEKTFTVKAKNIKPAFTQNGTATMGNAAVSANTYLYAQGITENEEFGKFAMDFALNIYKDGTYTQGFYDKYGDYYELSTDISGMPADPVVSIYNTDYKAESGEDPLKNIAGTVTVLVKTEGGTLSILDGSVLPDGAAVTGNGTSELKVIMTDNGSFEILCTYGDDTTATIPVSVNNIYNAPIDPYVEWDYNEYKVDQTDHSYEGEVKAILKDKNGTILIDNTTGSVPTYTFIPGGETEYTFIDYSNQVGTKGEAFTVKLPVTLKSIETETTQADTYQPNVAITGYAKFINGIREFDGAFVRTDSTRILHQEIKDETGTVVETNEINTAELFREQYLADHGSEKLYDDVNVLMAQTVFADKYIFNLDISDENEVKIFLKSDRYAEVPTYAEGKSDSIEGVSIVGRTLQISKNASFALHIVDSKNNATSVSFEVTNLGESYPQPNVTQVVTANGNEVRVYLTEPNLAGVTNLMITNTDMVVKTETNTNSEFYGKPYVSFTTNYPDGVTINYSYMYNDMQNPVTGSMIVKVTGVDTSNPQPTKWKWSANYDGNGQKYTNQDITLQLEWSKTLSEVVLMDADGNVLTELPKGVTVTYLGNRVTMIFEENIEGLRLKVTASANSELQNTIDIPAIKTIDKTPAELTESTEYSSNHKKATVTITSSENVTWPNGKTGITYELSVRANGTYEVRATDKAGNVSLYSVTFADLITEDMTITLSTAGSDDTIIDLENYQPKIGDTIYVKTNRAAKITLNGETTGFAIATGEWKAITIAEDVEGLYPSIRAVDAYGNGAEVQLHQIPLKDRTKPSILISKNLISVSLDMTEAELEALLEGNVIASDNVTAQADLKFTYQITGSGAGTHKVIYTVEDEAGNQASAEGSIRFYSGKELTITLNGSLVEREETIIISKGTQTITITHNGEPYKVEWREGLKSLGQMKNNTTVLTSYTEEKEASYTLELTESGYYTFLITTQGRETYRFVVYVEE